MVAGMPASEAEPMKELIKEQPTGRLGQKEEIASAVCLALHPGGR